MPAPNDPKPHLLKKRFFSANRPHKNNFSKSTGGEQPVEDILKFTCICVYLFMYLFVYVCHASWPNEKKQT